MSKIGLFVVILAATIFAFNSSADLPPRTSAGKTPIAVEASRLNGFDIQNPSRVQFGRLKFRGGLVLSSKYERFGGISAIRVEPDGARFLALSDRGSWLRGRILYEGERPVGIADAVMAPVLNIAGKPAYRWDTESLALDGRNAYVGVEGIDSIVRYEPSREGMFSKARNVELPPDFVQLPKNRGFEALEFMPRKFPNGGSLIALSERGLDEKGNLRAFLVGGPNPGSFAVRRIGDFDISDAALLPTGDLLILERSFTLTGGAATQIRRIPLKAIRPGAVVDGSVIFEADMRYQIDNMEGLSVHKSASGETVLTILSDDNFSVIQRTLLLQFTLSD